MTPPSIWLMAPSGLMTSPPSTAHQARVTRTLFLDAHLHRHGEIGRDILVAAEGEAACPPLRRALPQLHMRAASSITARPRGSLIKESR